MNNTNSASLHAAVMTGLFVVLLFLFWGEPDVIDVVRDRAIESLQKETSNE